MKIGDTVRISIQFGFQTLMEDCEVLQIPLLPKRTFCGIIRKYDRGVCVEHLENLGFYTATRPIIEDSLIKPEI